MYVGAEAADSTHSIFELKIPADGFSTLVMGIAARLATLVSYE